MDLLCGLTGLSCPIFPFRGLFTGFSGSSKYESSGFSIVSRGPNLLEVFGYNRL